MSLYGVHHLVATLIYLSQNYSYYIRGDRSPLMLTKFVIGRLLSDASRVLAIE